MLLTNSKPARGSKAAGNEVVWKMRQPARWDGWRTGLCGEPAGAGLPPYSAVEINS
jgi:hypothetical protein